MMQTIFKELEHQTGLPVNGIWPSQLGARTKPNEPTPIIGGFTLDCRGQSPDVIKARSDILDQISSAARKITDSFKTPVEVLIAIYTEEQGVRIFFILPPTLKAEHWSDLLRQWSIIHRAFLNAQQLLLSAGQTIIVRIGARVEDDWSYLLLMEEAPKPAATLDPIQVYLIWATQRNIAAGAVAIGFAFDAIDEWDDAAKVLELARKQPGLKASPGLFRKILNCLGVCYLELGFFDVSIERFQEMLSIEHDGLGYVNLSLAYMGKGDKTHQASDYLQAEECLRQCITLEPNNFDAWHNLCCVLAILGRRNEAEQLLLTAPIERGHLLADLQNDDDWKNPPPILSTNHSPRSSHFQYDIAISFAGEDRLTAQSLANQLSKHGISVFYDAYEQANLWGKDLYQHLADVYANKARFCLILVSQHYAKKLWTRHELRQAQSRAFIESQEYILPLRLDKTELPGLPMTVCYVDLRKTGEKRVAELIMEKLKRTGS